MIIIKSTFPSIISFMLWEVRCATHPFNVWIGENEIFCLRMHAGFLHKPPGVIVIFVGFSRARGNMIFKSDELMS